MTTLLLKNADVLVTMDAERREIPGGGVFIRDGVIEAVGPTAELPATADEVVSLAGCVALPGLVNTHHHMYQTLTRAIPGAQDAELFTWLHTLYPIWSGITPEMIRVSTLMAMGSGGALLSPSTGIIDSHGLMTAYLGDAENHGASLALKSAFGSATRLAQNV